ncbi:hypothetical protein A2U01_0080418, partial [Trifolium medium]|nr:hypothetical protein [Trifolium medium]
TDYNCPSTLLRTSLPKYTYLELPCPNHRLGLRCPDLNLGLPCSSATARDFPLLKYHVQETSSNLTNVKKDYN